LSLNTYRYISRSQTYGLSRSLVSEERSLSCNKQLWDRNYGTAMLLLLIRRQLESTGNCEEAVADPSTNQTLNALTLSKHFENASIEMRPSPFWRSHWCQCSFIADKISLLQT